MEGEDNAEGWMNLVYSWDDFIQWKQLSLWSTFGKNERCHNASWNPSWVPGLQQDQKHFAENNIVFMLLNIPPILKAKKRAGFQ